MKVQTESTVAPEDLLRRLLGAPTQGEHCVVLTPDTFASLCRAQWNTQWQWWPQQRREDLLTRMPEWIGFHTSGSSGAPRVWFRNREQLLAEVELLQRTCHVEAVDGVVTCAPPQHLYGFLLSFLLPAIAGLPMWFCPTSRPCSFHYAALRRPLFVAIPATLALLEREIEIIRSYDTVSIVHSTAKLPETGSRLTAMLDNNLYFVELFGSTETGLIATRTLPSQDQPWLLAEDVSFTDEISETADEVLLDVRGPRLAWYGDGRQLCSWQLDDFVHPLNPRAFVFRGRRTRLAKINGQRIDLDAVEQTLQQAIPGLDVACKLINDPLRGEHFDLLVVRDPQSSMPGSVQVAQIRRVCQSALTDAAQPRKIVVVQQLDRSPTGKLRHL